MKEKIRLVRNEVQIAMKDWLFMVFIITKNKIRLVKQTKKRDNKLTRKISLSNGKRVKSLPINV